MRAKTGTNGFNLFLSEQKCPCRVCGQRENFLLVYYDQDFDRVVLGEAKPRFCGILELILQPPQGPALILRRFQVSKIEKPVSIRSGSF